MQPDEGEGDIFILVIDETYGGDEDTYEADSERFRQELERQHSAGFVPANVGAGADIPAFLTVIATTPVPLWAAMLAAFFLGKPINDNLQAWKEIGAKLRSFFGRQVVLSRHGAAVLAVEAVFDDMGGIPKTIRLNGYRTEFFGEDVRSVPAISEIDPAPPVLNLGHIQHVFDIEADGVGYRVAVEGKTARAIRLNQAAR